MTDIKANEQPSSLRKTQTPATTAPLVLQDVLEQHLYNNNNNNDTQHSDTDEDDAAVSLAFFELANASRIAYRIESCPSNDNCKNKKQSPSLLTLRQDQEAACGQHTGGIVWETSVLLLNYLLWKKKQSPSFLRGTRILEVGAGCGLLGLGLASACEPREVIVTETSQVLPNLKANLESNRNLLKGISVRACPLDWTHVRQDAAAANISHNFADVVLGTDVIFSPALVDPLIETLDFVLANRDDAPVIYLCVQIRCSASHEQFFKKAARLFEVDEVDADELSAIPQCSWGPPTGCHLFQLARREIAESEPSKKRKKKKRRHT